jgi:endonuclease IV
MGNTIDLSMLCIDNIELGPIFQTFFSKMGSYDDKNDKSSSRAVVKTKLTTLKQKGARFFIHAPYNYNGADTKANNGMMIRELMDSVHVGALGVVVHVGHSAHNTTLPQSVFVDRMITNFKTLLAYATRETPLLLETPPGKERELFTTPWELGDFYLRLSEEERQKSGLVVDTCHVFDAGYDPIVYLHVLNDRAPGSIKLIHFNDSAGPCGCRRDIHFNPGGGFSILKNIVTKCELPKIAFAGEMGYIGPKRLAEVAKWAVAHSVPCVVE